MQIDKLQINHYKTIEEPLVINHFSNLHILIGPNNSGKTNILDALEMFFSPDLNPERFYDSSSDLNISLKFTRGDTLQINFLNNHRTYLLNNEPATGEHPKIQEAQKRIIRIKPQVAMHRLISHDLPAFEASYPDVYLEFCNALKEYFDDIEISKKLLKESIHSDRQDRPIERMGDGFKRLFMMLFYIFHPDFDLILIDEPEMHLHPTVLKRFLKVLMDKQFNNQVFLTTHSSVLVQPKTITHLWRVTRDLKRNTTVNFLDTASVTLTPERLVQELNADNSEMFFADKVLLVEGVSDRILMRGLIDHFYQGPHDIKVIYTGGKGNIDTYIQLFRAFRIPYLVMLDRDVLTGTWPEIIRETLVHAEHASLKQKIQTLKEHHIYILNGCLEDSYPRHYQTKDTKPLNTLYAAHCITEKDLKSGQMQIVNEIIANL